MDGNVRTQKNCVIVERKWSFAPKYTELKEIIKQLIDLHGADEVIKELGLGDYLTPHGCCRITIYKGIEVIWDEDHDKRIFWALDQIEERYPDLFEHIKSAEEHKGDLTLIIDGTVGATPSWIEFKIPELGGDYWHLSIEYRGN